MLVYMLIYIVLPDLIVRYSYIYHNYIFSYVNIYEVHQCQPMAHQPMVYFQKGGIPKDDHWLIDHGLPCQFFEPIF